MRTGTQETGASGDCGIIIGTNSSVNASVTCFSCAGSRPMAPMIPLIRSPTASHIIAAIIVAPIGGGFPCSMGTVTGPSFIASRTLLAHFSLQTWSPGGASAWC